MKNRRASWILSIVLILLMALPVMAQDEASLPADSTGNEVSTETEADVQMTEANEATEADTTSSSDDSVNEKENKEDSSADKPSGNASDKVSASDSSTGDVAESNEKLTDADPAFLNSSEDDQDTSSDEPVIEQAGTLTFVIIGKGKVDLNKDGNVICAPAAGYEVQSITADKTAVKDPGSKNAVSIKVGDQIPEDEIESFDFEDETTITFILVPEQTDDSDFGDPASATAIFG